MTTYRIQKRITRGGKTTFHIESCTKHDGSAVLHFSYGPPLDTIEKARESINRLNEEFVESFEYVE